MRRHCNHRLGRKRRCGNGDVVAEVIGTAAWGATRSKVASMRYKAKSIAALQLTLGSLPDKMRVEVFVKRHEAQLTAEAEQALPGPLELP